jgi:hypothetical protein
LPRSNTSTRQASFERSQIIVSGPYFSAADQIGYHCSIVRNEPSMNIPADGPHLDRPGRLISTMFVDNLLRDSDKHQRFEFHLVAALESGQDEHVLDQPLEPATVTVDVVQRLIP